MKKFIKEEGVVILILNIFFYFIFREGEGGEYWYWYLIGFDVFIFGFVGLMKINARNKDSE